MKSKIVKFILPLVFWGALWHFSAIMVNSSFLLPGIKETFRALFDLLCKPFFYRSVALSALRVTIGLLLGCFFGVAMAVLCHKFNLIHHIFSPFITVIRSTPVASFIVVLWVILSGDALSIFIGFIMVMPLIWQSTLNSFDAIDKNLIEVTEVFHFSRIKKFSFLTLPSLRAFLVPAIINSVGLAWKAEIAAEIIAYTKNSIGQGINDAKYNLDTATVFAWTLVIILFSIILESCTKALLRRQKNAY